MGALLGYARVSTADQTAALQEDDLRAAGCFRVWTDTASGASTDRPKLTELFDQLRFGDTLVVWRLDRLGRSLPHLIETIRVLEAREVGFKSVQEDIDTTTPVAGWCSTSLVRSPASSWNSCGRERWPASPRPGRGAGWAGGRR
jgi:DNA invertase Pin-like site-specific DNA recombinase